MPVMKKHMRGLGRLNLVSLEDRITPSGLLDLFAGNSMGTVPVLEPSWPGFGFTGGESTVVVSAIQIREITFSGADFIPIMADPDTPAYDPPHWVDSDLDGVTNDDLNEPGDRSLPIGYPRNSNAVISARFTVTLAAVPYSLPSGQLMVRGVNILSAAQPFYFTIPPTLVSLVGNDVVLPPTPISSPFPNTMNYGGIVINWEFSNNGGSSWLSAGQTENELFVTLDTPGTIPVFHTVIYQGVASAGNAGAADEATAITKIWEKFEKREISTRHIRMDIANKKLHYYKEWDTQSVNTVDLLKTYDGNCIAWSFFFADSLLVAGIKDKKYIMKFESKTYKANKLTNVNEYRENIFVKNWEFTLNGSSGDTTYPYRNAPIDTNKSGFIFDKDTAGLWRYVWGGAVVAEVMDKEGVAGQNTANPRATFANHVVVLVNGTYYDPGYGLKWANRQAWEDGAVDGFAIFDEPYILIRKNLTGEGIPADTEEKPAGLGNLSADGEYTGI